MTFDIFEVLPERLTIKVIDAGAMSLGPGTDPYAALCDAGVAHVVGFEPVQAECDKLSAAARISAINDREYLPYALGDGRNRTLHVSNYPMTSSLYAPYTALVEKFQGLSEVMQTVQTQAISTRRLDDIEEASDPDYLKLDVQGAEADILTGAQLSLEAAVLVHTEVEFVPLYEDQPLFAEVDQRLRQSGFLFHRFGAISGRTFKPLIANNDPNVAMSQQLWADAVYVKDFMHLDRLRPDKLLKLAVVLHLVYSSFDLAAFVLRAHDALVGGSLADRYVQRLIAPQSAI